MSQQFDAEQPRRQQPPQHQQQDGQRQSQSQGQGVPASEPRPTTADPGADGQSVYDIHDAEARERDEKPLVPPWKSRPDSNAI